ncbi:MAG: uroporphyrinogen-III C-methyltransferase [Tissierellia bacterium]|nr:uroporphyrinogen-III C-methyltransferase [Tissierellia bacterium]
MQKGKVKIVGAGIGSEDLITIKAKESLQWADVIIYDRLLNENLIKPYILEKETYYAGKKAKDHYLTQDEINNLIVEKAKSGKNVVRLKGGDPYVFGRGAEEAEILLKNGIEFEIIPGLTSGVVSLMYAGIPVTHRDASTSVSFITGHRKAGETENFRQYAKLDGTLVFYMGLGNIENITNELILGGMSKDKLAAVISNGAYPNQRVLVSTVKDIASEIKNLNFETPALIVIGDVIKYRDRLNFYEKLPLFGKNVVITRARTQISKLSKKLSELGANVIEAPAIEIKETIDENFLNEIKNFKNLNFTHLVFHSVNGIEIFMKYFLKYNDIRDLPKTICTIGKASYKTLAKYGIKADIVPENYIGEDLIEELKRDISNSAAKIMIPHSALSRDKLLKEYKNLGELHEHSIYTSIVPIERTELPKNIDYILFTSSSTVKNFKKLYEDFDLENKKIISIGPITSMAIEKQGLKLYRQSDEATIESMVKCIKEDVKIANAKIETE